MRPFVYIAGMRRTGTTVLAESLTETGKAIILIEPTISRHQINVNQSQRKMLNGCGAIKGLAIGSLEDWQRRLTEQLHVQQVGVKMIRHGSWKRIRDELDARFVVTGRHPKDIYASLAHRATRNQCSIRPLTPEKAAKAISGVWKVQRTIATEIGAAAVRYEDICERPDETWKRVAEYVESPLLEIGDVGDYLEQNRHRTNEHKRHGHRYTTKSVGRWKSAPEQIRKEARAFAKRLPGYMEWWGYET